MNWLRRELTCGRELRQSRVNNPSGFTAFTHLPLHRGDKNSAAKSLPLVIGKVVPQGPDGEYTPPTGVNP